MATVTVMGTILTCMRTFLAITNTDQYPPSQVARFKRLGGIYIIAIIPTLELCNFHSQVEKRPCMHEVFLLERV